MSRRTSQIRSRIRRVVSAPDSQLAPELRSLVSQSVALLGRVIEREEGSKLFKAIESTRQRMAGLREAEPDQAFHQLQKTYDELALLSRDEKRAFASAYTLMLELMNVCENAYRSYRLDQKPRSTANCQEKPSALIFVLTAHPTEARAPRNIEVFHEIQEVLGRALNRQPGQASFASIDENDLTHLLEIAWRTEIVRMRSPKVSDEAEHIYSMALRPEVIKELLEFGEMEIPFFMRSWVGGDKDGHPGVDEKALLQSLSLSRGKIIKICLSEITQVGETLTRIGENTQLKALRRLEKGFRQLKTIKAADGQKVRALRRELKSFSQSYVEKIGAIHPGLRQLKQIGISFPAFLIPLELRESSDVLMSPPKPKLAIDRMLETLARISRGADPRWYARGFIISMASELEHIEAAAKRQKAAFGELRLPIIPLFEEAGSLARSESIVSAMLKSPEIIEGVREHWNNMVEIMVGYSDSAKEAGVLASRLAIAKALPRLERVCAREKVTCVFFHGSGGSVDRGGGRIEDQTAWWPVSALRRYKVTVQGEMVERSFATASIARSQLEKIAASTSAGLAGDSKKIRKTEDDQTLALFAERISARYRETVASPDFLKLVEHATPYSYLSVLKIGSRPVKRVAQLSVSGLRAIPWVLCWTQTRVLFPTWWGVGSAWEETNEPARKKLRRAFREEPVFNSYVKALGFTLAKVELPVWRMYLDKSGLTPAEIEKATQLFAREYEKAQTFFHELTGEEEALWFRPWLAESIRLRSPMIHPLNLLQLLAEKEKDFQLLRIAVTGISSGMLTTG